MTTARCCEWVTKYARLIQDCADCGPDPVLVLKTNDASTGLAVPLRFCPACGAAVVVSDERCELHDVPPEGWA